MKPNFSSVIDLFLEAVALACNSILIPLLGVLVGGGGGAMVGDGEIKGVGVTATVGEALTVIVGVGVVEGEIAGVGVTEAVGELLGVAV